MATKTSSKTATRKPAPKAFGAARKITARKQVAEPKTKVLKKEPKRDVAPEHPQAAAPAKSRTLPPKAEPRSTPPPSREAESVSLIDRKRPRKKTEGGEVKTKREVLPPISRIRASLEAPAAPPKPATPAKPASEELISTPPSGKIAADTTAPAVAPPPSAEAEAPPAKIILIKPPIIVKQLAAELGLK